MRLINRLRLKKQHKIFCKIEKLQNKYDDLECLINNSEVKQIERKSKRAGKRLEKHYKKYHFDPTINDCTEGSDEEIYECKKSA